MSYRKRLYELLSRLENRQKKLHLYRGQADWSLPPVVFRPNATVVEVVGSKGKTTVSFYLAAFLSSLGFRVGLFTSPHLVSVNERFQIWQDSKSRCISDKDLFLCLQKVLQKARRLKCRLSYFESLFFTAVLWFNYNECDFIVQEAGLGGRYDATNSVENRFVVITKIELEHTNILGSSSQEILEEKAAVVKDSTEKVFIYPSLTKGLYYDCVPFADKIVFLPKKDWRDFALEIVGHIVGKRPKGFYVQVPGRRHFLIKERKKSLVLDVAHTPVSVKEFLEFLPKRNWRCFFSIARDKRVSQIIGILGHRELIGSIFYVKLDEPRILLPTEFLNLIGNIKVPIYLIDLNKAKEFWANATGDNIVMGSHYLVGQCLSFLGDISERKK